MSGSDDIRRYNEAYYEMRRERAGARATDVGSGGASDHYPTGGSSLRDLLGFLPLCVGACGLGVGLVFVFSLVAALDDRSSASETPSTPAPDVAESATAQSGFLDVLGGADFAVWVIAGVALLGAFGLVLRAVRGAVRDAVEVVRDFRDDQRERRGGKGAALVRELGELQARHHELSTIYGAYLTDPLEVLARPLLNDVTSAHTAEFVEAYAELNAIGPEANREGVARYRDAVSRAWKAWRAADAEAVRVGTRHFSVQEQKRIRQAVNLLTLAGDGAVSEFERTSALKQAHRLIEGLVTLPEGSVLALESAVRPALRA